MTTIGSLAGVGPHTSLSPDQVTIKFVGPLSYYSKLSHVLCTTIKTPENVPNTWDHLIIHHLKRKNTYWHEYLGFRVHMELHISVNTFQTFHSVYWNFWMECVHMNIMSLIFYIFKWCRTYTLTHPDRVYWHYTTLHYKTWRLHPCFFANVSFLCTVMSYTRVMRDSRSKQLDSGYAYVDFQI